MTSKWKRLALTLVSATLFGVMLTACSGGGGGGGGTSTPKPTPTPGGTVTPSDEMTDYTVDAESKTITANDGSWTIEVTEDVDGNNVITKNNELSLENIDGQSYAVVSDEVTEDETAGIITVVRTLAVPRSALDSGNEAVNALLMMALDDEDVVYATFTFRYNTNGDLLSVTVEYADYTVQYEGDGAGGLVLSNVDEELAGLYGAILGEVADEENVKELILKLAEEALAEGKDCIEITQKEFGKNIIASGECGVEGDNVVWTLDDEGTLIISGEGEMGNFHGDFNTLETPWVDYQNEIKKAIIRDGVTSLGNDMFRECYNLQEVVLPDSLIRIGNNVFTYCEQLTTIVIPEGVTSIGYGAFSECKNLSSLIIPESVVSIGDQGFWGCNKLVTAGPIGSGCNYEFGWTTTIPEYAFSWAQELYSVTIPSSVTQIGKKAFEVCTSLTDIELPEGITSIEKDTFGRCGSLETIIIPENVTNIGTGAFYECSSLKEITIPESVTHIGAGAFSYCSSLKEITISQNVESIGGDNEYEAPIDDVFLWCDALENIYVSDDNEYYTDIDGVLFNKDCTELIYYPRGRTGSYYTVPEGVKQISNDAFNKSKNLVGVTIPEGVESIGMHGFYSCDSLQYIMIPKSLTIIADYAFDSFDGGVLTDVYYTGNEEEWGTIVIGVWNKKLTSANIHYNSDF